MTAVIENHARNATLEDLALLLQDQQARKVDIVAPASAIRSRDGLIVVENAEQELTEDGVTVTDGTYRPTAVFDEGVADKLDIPLKYVRRMREERPDLYDSNVNGWLHGRKAKVRYDSVGGNDPEVLREAVPGYPKNLKLRAFRGDDGGIGVARALLSDRHATVDHFDVLTAALSGVKAADPDAMVVSCDLTERRMIVKVASPAVKILAPKLLEDYRNPFGGDPVVGYGRGGDVEFWRQVAQSEGMGFEAGTEPVLFAGFVLSNSETGGGAFSIVPRLLVQICRNGLTITADAMKQVHLGSKLEEGVVRWSAETQSKNIELITSKARDAVAEYLSTDYLHRAVEGLEEKSGTPVRKAEETIKVVGKKLAFTEEQIAGVLDMFIAGGQLTAGGVLQAVTAYAQTEDDADVAYDLESKAVRAMEFAAV